MKHPYSGAYQPSFPSLPVVLTNAEEGLRTVAQNALIDTGSDGTLVPMALLERSSTLKSMVDPDFAPNGKWTIALAAMSVRKSPRMNVT